MNLADVWSAFWSNEEACEIFEADASDSRQLYFCLGEIAYRLCQDHQYTEQMMVKFHALDSVRKAAFLDACPSEVIALMKTDLMVLVNSESNCEYLYASILRSLLSLHLAEMIYLLKKANIKSSEIVKTGIADEVVKTKRVVDEALGQLGSFCVFEDWEDFQGAGKPSKPF
jgi:hypothetical protein